MSQDGSFDGSFADDEDHVIAGDRDETDYYAILNVSRDATIEEITRAYKQRCLIFHPDRHQDDENKKAANRIFVVLREAHETLTDPSKRAIYDAVGRRGLDLQGWQLAPKSYNAENIRREYEFLTKLRDDEIMLQRTHPATTFIVKISFAGLFVEQSEDRYPPTLVGASVGQSVDCSLTTADRVGLVGRVKTANGRGDPTVAVNWKRSVSQKMHSEAGLSINPSAVTSSWKLSYAVSPKIGIVVQPSLQYFLLQTTFVPSLALVYSMQLQPGLQGSFAFSLNHQTSSLTTSIVKTEYNLPKYIANITLSPMGPSGRFTYFQRFPENELCYEATCQLGAFGVMPVINCERRLTRHSKIGFALSLAIPSMLLQVKFRLKMGFHTYELHVLLCDNDDDIRRACIYGLVAPYIVLQLSRKVFHKAYDRFMRVFDDQSDDQVVDEVKKEEALTVTNLMRPTAERIAEDEAAKMGLVIVEAKYGQLGNSGVFGAEQYPVPGEKLADVTVPLQSMVHDSTLRIFSSKSQIPGFYDPCPGEPKMLRVVYRFRERLHQITIMDELPLSIPQSAHVIS